MRKLDGGPAFPTDGIIKWNTSGTEELILMRGGMSLHQWYAGIALGGILAHENHYNIEPREARQRADAFADAMIAEREPKS